MKALVFLNGNYSKEDFKNIDIKKYDIFCADGGVNNIVKMNILPKYLFGDFDSIDPKNFKLMRKNNVKIYEYPKDKDKSDFEIILLFLKKLDYEEIVVIGAFGKRIDFTINNLFLFEKYENVVFLTKKHEVYLKTESFNILNKKNKKVSFVSLDKKIKKLTLKGFKYNLNKENVNRSDSLLISNEIVDKNSRVSFKKGKLIVFIEK